MIATSILLSGLASLVLAASSAPARLTEQERALAAFVDAHQDEALALLESVVNINSGTHNLAGVEQVGRIFRAQLDALGFETTWVDLSGVGRAGHLVANHPRAGPRILLIGHLDTVFPEDGAFQKFERLDATTARGPGVIDMKGGDVIVISALKALAAVGLLESMNVIVVMTGDEEDPGRPLSRSREALFAAARGADFAIGFEDGDGLVEHAVIARRGTTVWELSVEAQSGHSSQVFSREVGNGATYEAARILDEFRRRMAGEEHLTFNPGVFLGGTSVELDAERSRGSASGKSNVVAAQARVKGDLRALTGDQFERAKRTMRSIVGASLPGTRSAIAFDEGYPPLAPSDGNRRLLALYDRASRDLDLGDVSAVSPDRAGAADVAFVAGVVPMILDGVGLKGRGGHSPAETADLGTLAVQTKRAAVLLARLAQKRP